MFRRHPRTRHAVTAALALSATGLLAAGCSDDEKATPRVVFTSDITPGAHTAAECPESGTWFKIGDFGTPGSFDGNGQPLDPPRPVDNGGSDQQGSVTANCRVVPEGDGFRVEGQAVLTGATGGSFLVAGLFRPTGEQQGISASFTRQGVTYKQSNCVAKYTETEMTVAAGRVWATVTCPDAESASTQRICLGRATFRFENCDQ